VNNELVTKKDLVLAFENSALALENLALALENMKLSLTIRLGGMIAAGVAALAVLQLIY
jgi:hypothetical protein